MLSNSSSGSRERNKKEKVPTLLMGLSPRQPCDRQAGGQENAGE